MTLLLPGIRRPACQAYDDTHTATISGWIYVCSAHAFGYFLHTFGKMSTLLCGDCALQIRTAADASSAPNVVVCSGLLVVSSFGRRFGDLIACCADFRNFSVSLQLNQYGLGTQRVPELHTFFSFCPVIRNALPAKPFLYEFVCVCVLRSAHVWLCGQSVKWAPSFGADCFCACLRELCCFWRWHHQQQHHRLDGRSLVPSPSGVGMRC